MSGGGAGNGDDESLLELVSRLKAYHGAKASRGVGAVRRSEVPTPLGMVADPGQRAEGVEWSEENWALWRGREYGTIPRWEWRTGPGRKVTRLLAHYPGYGPLKTAELVEAVWGSIWMQLARLEVVDPLEFGARLGRHASQCGVCQGSSGLLKGYPQGEEFLTRLWALVLHRTGLTDILRVLARARREGEA